MPIYDIKKSYLENAEEGPIFSGPLVDQSREISYNFLGFDVSSPIGIPAGPLLNASWISFAAQMGFDILTYKTIRSKAHNAHPVPNMIYVETNGFLSPEQEGGAIKVSKSIPKTMDELALTNSFGIPSRDHDYLLADIAKAQKSLRKGQVMIVSVVGTPRPNEDFGQDFAEAAKLAIDGGAQIIEANFSCPNVLTCEGSLDQDPEGVFEISSKIKKQIGSVPLIIKIGVYTDIELLKQVMTAAARAGVEAVCGINAMSMKVYNDEGMPALGEKRLSAGICGGPIRLATLDFIEKARAVNTKEKLGLTIMGTGGVTSYEHFDLFFDKGADVAMCATGMMWDPHLAQKYHNNGKKPWMKK